jgi:hypothetical protein
MYRFQTGSPFYRGVQYNAAHFAKERKDFHTAATFYRQGSDLNLLLPALQGVKRTRFAFFNLKRLCEQHCERKVKNYINI